MQENNHTITLKSYLDLVQLLKQYQGSHEVNRSFGLSHNEKEITLLNLWKGENLYRIKGELDSSKYLRYLSLFTYLFSFLFLLFGLFTGFTLLSYSGKEPVNIMYLLFVMVGLPLVSIILTILSMYTGNSGAKFFNHFSPLYYLEKMINFFYVAKKVDFSNVAISPTLAKWIFLHRLQLFTFLFAIGLFLALILTVVSKDIAFAWSSTLEINAVSFQSTLACMATPWDYFFPSAVPTLELVEVSHYFRLGETLDVTMVQNADKLGAWWKFLAMAMVVYAILLRLVLWFWIHIECKRALKQEFLSIARVSQLLSEFKTPYVSTQGNNVEEHLEVSTSSKIADGKLAMDYNALLGWNYSDKNLHLIVDAFSIHVDTFYSVGGKNSFKEDQEVLEKLEGDVLLYVKAWEPPTMDFMDFVEELLEKEAVKKVDICPLGTANSAYKSQSKDLEVWLRKLELVESPKFGVIDV